MGYWYQDNVNTSLSHTASYSYDGVNRLASAVAKDLSSSTLWSQGYNYTSDGSNGRYGNVTCSVGYSGYCSNLTFDGSTNRIHQIGGATASYDAAGDLTGDGTSAYTWDAEGRLTSGANETFVYSAFGRMAQVIRSGTNDAQFLYDPAGQDIGHYSQHNSFWWAQIINLGGRTLAYYNQNAETLMYHRNALGTSSFVTDGGGNFLEEFVEYPWGSNWLAQGNGSHLSLWDQQFAGLPFIDNNLQQYPAPFRNYSTTLGRWMTPDPMGGDLTNPQSLNRYAYAMNNPTTLTDPTGLQSNPGIKPCESSNMPMNNCYTQLGMYWGSSPGGFFNVPMSPFSLVGIPVVDASKYGWIPWTSGRYAGPTWLWNDAAGTELATSTLAITAYWGPLVLGDAFTWFSQLPTVVSTLAPNPFAGQAVRAAPRPPPPPSMQPNLAWERGWEYGSCVMNPDAFLNPSAPSDQTASSSYGAAQAPWPAQLPSTSERPSNRAGSWEVPQALGGGASLLPSVPDCVRMARGGR